MYINPKQSFPQKLCVVEVYPCFQNSLWESMCSLGGWPSSRVCAELAALMLLCFIRMVQSSTVLYAAVLETDWKTFSLSCNNKICIANDVEVPLLHQRRTRNRKGYRTRKANCWDIKYVAVQWWRILNCYPFLGLTSSRRQLEVKVLDQTNDLCVEGKAKIRWNTYSW